MGNHGLDIVIVNWNSGPLLKRCVDSVNESITNQNLTYHITVVDNGSVDGSTDLLADNSRLTIIRNSENYGFSRSCNIGAENGTLSYILFLNPDTEIFSDVLHDSVKWLDGNSYVGIMGVRQTDREGKTLPSCSRFLRLRNLIYDITGLSKLFPAIFKPSTIMTDWDHNSSAVVDQVMGAFMMVRRGEFYSVNCFDEQFFVYFEDMDLAKKMNKAGLNSYYNSEMAIYHKGCGTTEAVKSDRLFHSITSRINYARKYWPQSRWVVLYILTIFFEPIFRLLYLLIKFRISGIGSLFKTYFKLFRNLP